MTTFDNYDHLPAPIIYALAELEDFIGDLDGKTMGTESTDGEGFIDEGTVDADDAVKAFNTIVAALTPPEPADTNRAENILREFEELHGQITIDERKWLRDRIAAELTPPEPTEGQVEVVARAIYDFAPCLGFNGCKLREDCTCRHQARAALAALSLQDHGWKPMNGEPNDGKFRWYGLHVKLSNGHNWFEAHYVAYDNIDGRVIAPGGDEFSEWSFQDFEVWCDAPPPPVRAMVAEDGTK